MKFRTQSNSIYEIDLVNDKIRQLSSVDIIPDRRKEWRTFASASPIEVGSTVYIIWNKEQTDVGWIYTRTSKVVEIYNDIGDIN